jgi:hypothetical protein
MNRWQFVLHQRALEEIDGLRPAERREVRAFLLRLAGDPWQNPTRRFGRRMIAPIS